MKKIRVQAAAAVVAMGVLLGGCGDAPYELTDAEQAIIVNYSAHIVTKYNSLQGEGLAYVYPQEETEKEDWEYSDAGSVDSTELTDNAVPVEAEPVEPSVDLPQATLDELFGQAGVSMVYVGARLTTSYTQDNYYALYPNEGKQYLILGVDVINMGTTPTVVDLLSRTSKFEVLLRGGVKAKSESTLLLDDFTVFEGTLAPGETRETVIVFQIPADTTSLESMILTGDNGTGNYEIILQ